MATVEKAFADNLVKHSGYHNGESDNALGDNPRCTKIVEYENAYGGTAYGLVFETCWDQFRYERETEFVRRPRVYWQYAI